MQEGLDFSGEFIDNINEYSVQFEKLGFSAEDMFAIFKTGSENGAFNLDKIGDAVKEFSIRAVDGSNTTIEGFTKLGLNADDMASRFAQGGETARNAFMEVVQKLGDVDDAVEQNVIGVDLFGTMWEDLGPQVVTSLGEMQTGFNGTADTMNKIKEIKYDNLSDMFEGLKRNVEMLTLPLGNALMPILEQIVQFIMSNMPAIEGIIGQMTPIITDLFANLLPPMMQLVQTIMPVLFDLLNQIIPFVSQILEAILPVLIDLINTLLPPIMQIIQAVLPIIIQLLQPILQLLEPLIQLLKPIIDLFMTLLQPLLKLINIILPPIINLFNTIIKTILPPLQSALSVVANILSNVFGKAFETIGNIISGVINTFKKIIDFVKNVFMNSWKGAWEGVKNIFSNIANALGNIFKTPINWIIGAINAFIRGLNKIKIPDWVPGVRRIRHSYQRDTKIKSRY